MKVPKNTARLTISKDLICFFDKNNELISSNAAPIPDVASFLSKNEMSYFDTLKCSCGGHMLSFSVFDDDLENDFVYVQSWVPPSSLPYSFKFRVKTAFRILFGKMPFCDEYLFSKKQMICLRDLVSKYIGILEEKDLKSKAKKIADSPTK